MDGDDTRLADYLLGRLPDAEQARLEEEYLADPEVQDRLLVVEDDLVDAYVAGRLSGPEREGLEAGVLASPRGRRKLDVVRTLTAHAAASRDAGAGTSRVMRRLPPSFLPSAAAAALLIVPLLAWSVWKTRLPMPGLVETASAPIDAGKRPPRETSPPTTRPGDLPEARVAAVTLAPVSRDAALPRVVKIEKGVEQIRVVLTLDGGARERYRVDLLDGLDAVKWSARGLERRDGGPGAALVLDLPSALFESGEYAFLLSSDAEPARPIASYSLTIEKN